MNTYEQATGRWLDDSGRWLGTGYSGKAQWKNNPSAESVHNLGPIPHGIWRIGMPFNSDKHGPFAMPLSPVMGTNTYERSGFLIHGDSLAHPGEASEGCIILPPAVRYAIWRSGDESLHVVAGTQTQGENHENSNQSSS